MIWIVALLVLSYLALYFFHDEINALLTSGQGEDPVEPPPPPGSQTLTKNEIKALIQVALDPIRRVMAEDDRISEASVMAHHAAEKANECVARTKSLEDGLEALRGRVGRLDSEGWATVAHVERVAGHLRSLLHDIVGPPATTGVVAYYRILAGPTEDGSGVVGVMREELPEGVYVSFDPYLATAAVGWIEGSVVPEVMAGGDARLLGIRPRNHRINVGPHLLGDNVTGWVHDHTEQGGDGE